jgi:hypothetical protein
VYRRHRLHEQRRLPAELRTFPRAQPLGSAAQACGGTNAGEHQWSGEGELPSSLVEVVGVLVVADQHDVHTPEIALGDRWSLGLSQVPDISGRVEGWVDHETATGDVHHDRRPADETYGQL